MRWCNATAPPNHKTCDPCRRKGITCTGAINPSERRFTKDDNARDTKKRKLRAVLIESGAEEYLELSNEVLMEYLQSSTGLKIHF